MSESSFLHLVEIGGRVIATVKCEKIGARESQILETELRAQGPRTAWRMAVDLGEVTVMASMGLGMLVSIHKACKENRGVMICCCVRPEIMSVLTVTHLHKVLKIVGTRDDAVKAVQ